MSLFEHIAHGNEIANDNMRLSPEMQAVKETTLNRFYENTYSRFRFPYI